MSSIQDKVIIIDDVLSEIHMNRLEEFTLNPYTPWYYNKFSSYSKQEVVEQFISGGLQSSSETFQFTHNFLMDGEFSRYYPEIAPLLASIPFSMDRILRVKMNMTVVSKNLENKKYGMPHLDYPDYPENATAIYYVNDSDGDTFIFNERDKNMDFDKLTIKQQISPKKGRLVIFDGSLLHAGNNPTTDTPRVVININFIPYKEMKYDF